MRSILRAILTVVLLLGGGAGDWASAPVQTHESCCCGTPAGGEDRCPCPKPEGTRTPSRSNCTDRAAAVASLAVRRTQGDRRIEPRPEPATWAKASEDLESNASFTPAQGRDPDLGRHLARLSSFRI